MKSLDAKKLLSIVFISIIVFFMGTIGFKLVMTKVLHIYPEETNAAESQPDGTQAPSYDWSKDYPFSGDYGFTFKAETAPVAKAKQPSAVEQYESFVRSIEGNIDYYTSNLLLGRMQFVEMNASFNKFVGMNIVSGTDSVVVMNNGYLTFEAHPISTDYAVKSTTYFANWLKEREIDFLYVQCPSKESPFDNQLPYGIDDNYNANADNLINGLDENNVPYIDLRQNLNSDFDDYYSRFFKTDHHWKPETGVWASGVIAKELNNRYNYGLKTEIGNLDNYIIDVYEEFCFGSQGKKATLKYADPEDISLIYPKNNSLFTVKYDNDDPITGKFEDTLLKKSVFSKKDYYNVSTYSAYFHGNHALTTIRNHRVLNSRRVVYIMDSFSASVIPYLAMDVEYMLVLDLRSFNGSVTKVIDDFNPQTVIVAYNPSTFSADTSHHGTFNFE